MTLFAVGLGKHLKKRMTMQPHSRLRRFACYEEYVHTQSRANSAKTKCTGVTRAEIASVADAIRQRIGDPRFGLCHGVRNAWEVEEFSREFFECVIVGTDIAKTASRFGAVIWDFHEINPSWTGRADFVYSNSLDHAYDPTKAIEAWRDALRPGGLMIVHWSQMHNRKCFGAHGADCFQSTRIGYLELLTSLISNVEIFEVAENQNRCVFIGEHQPA
jgi:hypothetical protein